MVRPALKDGFALLLRVQVRSFIPMRESSNQTVASMNQTPGNFKVVESNGYLEVGDEQLYYVLHKASKPQAIALLAGHFPTERVISYALWIRWARFLARHGITALHFDYRGSGESTGDFAAMSFTDWREDIAACATWLRRQTPGVPLIISGLGMGGLLAAQPFQEGLGDALLLWSPPSQGDTALKEILIRRVSFDYATKKQSSPRTLADYITLLDSGGSVSVDGYSISGKLWRESAGLRLNLPPATGSNGSQQARPWKIVKLASSEIPLVAGAGVWRVLNPRVRMDYFPLNPDLDAFFTKNLDWLATIIGA
jgi:pimeloyl-ACP methyl ester carboxylesterase